MQNAIRTFFNVFRVVRGKRSVCEIIATEEYFALCLDDITQAENVTPEAADTAPDA